LLFRIVPSAVFTVNEKLKIITWNNAAEKITGYKREEIMGRKCTVIRTEAKNCASCCLTLGEVTAPVSREEISILRKDGKKRRILKNSDHIVGKNGEIAGAIISFIDITELRDVEKKKNQLENEMTEIKHSAVIGRLASGIAHEINNPASALQNDMFLLKSMLGKAGCNKEKLISVIERDIIAAGRICSIAGTVKNSGHSGEWGPFDLHKEIDLQVSLLLSKHDSGITIVREYSGDLRFEGYQNEIGRVILNLLSNSFDAVENGGEIRIKTESSRNKVCFEIRDSGSGIPESIKSHIFDPFFSTKEVGKGTGIGLYLSRNIVENHGGELIIISEKGKGTSAVVKLPVKVH
ncbi:MAG: two-component system sensor histidine kinase NtrB, partial [Fibrobacterota bacterium]